MFTSALVLIPDTAFCSPVLLLLLLLTPDVFPLSFLQILNSFNRFHKSLDTTGLLFIDHNTDFRQSALVLVAAILESFLLSSKI